MGVIEGANLTGAEFNESDRGENRPVDGQEALAHRNGGQASGSAAGRAGGASGPVESNGAGDEAEDEAVGRLVHKIRTLQREHGLRFALDIGRLVVNSFYGGDARVLRDRGSKDVSLRKLAQHPELPMSAAALYNAIAVFEVIERVGVYTCKHLSQSHVRVVLPLAAPEQESLLRQAEECCWSVEELAQAARQARGGEARGARGRPPLPRFVKAVHSLRRFADERSDLLEDLEALDSLKTADIQELRDTAAALMKQCEVLHRRLEARLVASGGK